MVMVMGTSICHMVLGERNAVVEGMCGVVEDGILPGLFGYEAGQSAVGDIFAWFVDNLVPPPYHEAAARDGSTSMPCSSGRPRSWRPASRACVALDWWNGNRSMLVDVDLSGLLIGATLATTAPEIYRALIEGTAFGTRMIVEAFERRGCRSRSRGVWWAAGAQPAAHADLRGRHAARRSPWLRRRRPRPSGRPCSLRSRQARRPAATTASRMPLPRWRSCARSATCPIRSARGRV